MSVPRSQVESAYMQWAKLHSAAPVNLATSAIAPLSLGDLPIHLEDLALNAPGSYGYAPLQERLGSYLGVSSDSIVSAPGTSMANLLAMAAAFEPGDEVLFERPTYEPMLQTAVFLGAEVRRFERRRENGFRVDPDELRRRITPRTRLVVLANLHNPTSALTSEADLRAAGEIARGVGARVLVDEVYLEALFYRRPPAALRLGPEFISTSSLTKAYGLGGLRCGWVVAEPEMARRIWRIRDLHDVNSAHVAERIATIVMDHREKLEERGETLLGTNRPIVGSFLDEHPEMEVSRPPFGTVLMLRAPIAPSSGRAPGGDADAFCRLLRERYETSVVPGAFFGMPDCFRVGIGGGTAELKEGLERLAAANAEFQKRGA